MADLPRSESELIAAFATNTTGRIKSQQGRDLIRTVFGWRSVNDPTANNDSVDTAGIGVKFSIGSQWINTNGQEAFICVDDRAGIAVWTPIEEVIGQALTAAGDTNIDVALGGTPATALLEAVSITVTWTGTLSVARGGTGANNAGDARTNLGLGSAATHAAGDFDSAGAAAAALASAEAYSDAGDVTTLNAAEAYTDLQLLVAEAYTDAGLLTKQPLDATLTALAAQNWVLNSLPVGTGADAVTQLALGANTFPARSSAGNVVAKTITDFGFSLVDDADAATARATLGLANVENTALSTWAGSANLTTLGTVVTGTWQGTAIAAGFGGVPASVIALALGGTPTLKPLPQWYKVTVGHADWNAAANTKTINLAVLPAGAVLHLGMIHHTAALAGGGITSYTAALGLNGGSTTKYLTGFSVFSAPASGNLSLTSYGGAGANLPDCQGITAGWTVTATGTCDGGHQTQAATAGSVDYYLLLSSVA